MRGHGGTGGEDGARDVGAYNGGVGGDCEAEVTLMPVDGVEGDGFDIYQELIGAGGGRCTVGDLDGRALGGEDGSEVFAWGIGGACDFAADLVDDRGHDWG